MMHEKMEGRLTKMAEALKRHAPMIIRVMLIMGAVMMLVALLS